jgi:hypothetical protein
VCCSLASALHAAAAEHAGGRRLLRTAGQASFGRLAVPSNLEQRISSTGVVLPPSAAVQPIHTAAISEQHRQLLQQQGGTTGSANSAGSPTADSVNPDTDTGTGTGSGQHNSKPESSEGASDSASTPTINYCPPWAPHASLASGVVTLPTVSTAGPSGNLAAAAAAAGSTVVPFTANYSSTGTAGVTTSDRVAVMQAAAQDAVRAALGNRSELPAETVAASNSSPGLFEPLTTEEILAGGGNIPY